MATSQLDSPFQLQEHLKALYFNATKSEENTTVPMTRESALNLATPPEGVDRSLWLYELCRFLVQKTNSLIVGFFSDTPPCTAKDCPEMRASEWQYLCAVHDPPKSCCAIDYCCHTLDWAANILTSQKHFPSRLTLGGGDSISTQQSVRQLTNIFRRVYRMFAHAWFQHRDVFWSVENQEGLYVFYKTVCDSYNLIPEDNYTVPPEAEGLQSVDEMKELQQQEIPKTLYSSGSANSPVTPESARPDDITTTILSTGATTRRHKHTPSTGSFVTTIAEGDEENEDSALRNPLMDMTSTMRRDPPASPPKQTILPSRPAVKTPPLQSIGSEQLGKGKEEQLSEVKRQEDPTKGTNEEKPDAQKQTPSESVPDGADKNAPVAASKGESSAEPDVKVVETAAEDVKENENEPEKQQASAEFI
jgi:hypothetical protein